MIEPDDWRSLVAASLKTICPACNSPKVTAGACAVGSATVHQEYICEDCQYEFTALFALVGYYPGQPA
ncbi:MULTISPECIES: hypothetical protein [Burkholderia]|uniref:hypothetical protein n=1 Tax=Burkholderia TaxID=32008 RepID=UPI0011AFBFB9|nr:MULTISPECIES: hypothetical protein [unclassified Burkholderia]